MSLPDKLYAWTDQDAVVETYYTDTTSITIGTHLYDNSGIDTGKTVDYINGDTFNIACQLTVTTEPEDATVTFDTGTVSDKTCIVPNGTSVTYTVARTGYVTQNITTTVSQEAQIETITLVKQDYTLTIDPTPADATVTFSTGAVSGNTCIVPYETTVSYTISKTGYTTSQTYTKTVTQNETITAPALEEQLSIQYPDNTRLMITGLTEQTPPDNNLCKVQLTRVTNSNGHGAMVSYTEDSKFVSLNTNPGIFWVEKNSNITVRAYYVTKSGIFKTEVYHYANKEFNITGDTDISLTSGDYT